MWLHSRMSPDNAIDRPTLSHERARAWCSAGQTTAMNADILFAAIAHGPRLLHESLTALTRSGGCINKLGEHAIS